ncbi:MAG: VCBS repeat-containing protein, partial [Bacteroidetes bacterium]|nr:VCBS repeat-containing protein [Bacteroidota bacterium]
MRTSLRTLSIIGLMILSVAVAQATPPTISSTSPATNALNVSVTANITVTFNQAMTNGSLNANTIKVYGNYRGFYSADYSVSGNTVTINPDSSFKPGEVITVTVTTGVLNAGTEQMASPKVYSFTVDAPAGYAKFRSPSNYVAYGTGSGNHYTTLADLNNDGYIDIATTSSLHDNMSVLLNNGDGTFASRVDYATLNAFDISAADVNGDGDMDLVVANNNIKGFSVFINNGSGSFSTRNDYEFSAFQSNAQYLVTADMDGDGDIDVVLNDLTSNYLHLMKNTGGSFSSAGGDFAFTTKFGPLAAGDLDKDGDMDIVASGATVDSVEYFTNNGTGTLTMQTRFYWSNTDGPTDVLVADINSTTGNKNDLVFLSGIGEKLTYFRNNFTELDEAAEISVGEYPIAVKAADIDSDNDLDLLVANYNDATFSVLTNAGSIGSYAYSVTQTNTLSNYPDDLATADLDGDGDMDVVTIHNDATLSVFQNYNGGHVASITPVNGSLDQSASSNIVIVFDEHINSGTLTSSTVKISGSISGNHAWTLSSYVAGTYTATLNPTVDFVPGEVVTVIVTKGVQNSIGVALERAHSSQFVIAAGNGASFAASTDYAAGTQPNSIILADLNADGDADLVAVNSGSDNVSVRLNNGDGTFGSESLLSTGDNPSSVAAGDVDGDGDIDLVVTVTGADQLARFLNNGSGSFGSAATFSTSASPTALSLGDIDTDGDLDVVYVASGQGRRQSNNGSGAFSDEYGFSSAHAGIVVADVNNDGDLDVIYTYDNSIFSNVTVYNNSGTGVWSSLFTGSGSYTLGYTPTGVVVRDFNNDGYVDVVTTGLPTNGTISYLQNNQNGTFAARVDYSVATSAQPRGLTAADVDGDGDLDIIVANGAGDNAKLFLNNGSGVFSNGGEYATGDNPYAIASADLNGDGLMDIATANNGGGSVSVKMNVLSAPIVTTSAATSVTSTGATLNGTVNALNLGTVTRFAYKLNSAGAYAAGDTVTATPTGFAGGAATSISAALTGLQQNTMYNFKAIGVNSSGTTEGSALSFTTSEDALVISSISPTANDLDVDTAANITVTFNVPANQDSLNASNVKVWGSVSGPIAGSFSYDGPSKTMTFNPTGFFRAGEVVNFIVTNRVASSSGFSFTTAKTYSFTVAASGTGPGFFAVQTVSNHFSKSESRFLSADVDKDGDADLIGYYSSEGVTVSLNNSGTFAAPVLKYTRPDNTTAVGTVRYADMDNDGFGDLIVLQSNSTSFQSIVILKNNGSGEFTRFDSIATPTPWLYGFDVNDYNNDGKIDIAYPYNSTIYVKYNSAGWSSSASFASGGGYITSADIDSDGDIDLLPYSYDGTNVLLNNGSGSFGSAVLYTGSVEASGLNPVDVNGDGDLDLVYYGGGPKQFHVRLNNGDGTFASAVSYTLAVQPAISGVGDLDADGDIDIAFVYQNESLTNVAYNDGSGVFSQQAVYGARLPGLAVMDYDNDGDLDLVGKDYLSNVDLKLLQNTTPTTPGTSASSVNVSNDYGTQFRVNWTNGSGNGRIVVMKQGSAVTWTPSDNATYTANASFGTGMNLGDGSYVIYNGVGTSVDVTNLTVSTTYHVAVFEYNGLSGMEKYKTADPASGSDLTNSASGYPFDTTSGSAFRYSNNGYSGSNDAFAIPDGFTYELWTKPSSIGSQMVILDHGDEYMWIAIDATGKFFGRMYDENASSNVEITGTTTAVAGQWYHVALTGATGSPLKLYVNGVLEATSGGSIGELVAGTQWLYTATDNAENYYYSGDIDELRVWSDIRTESELRGNMYKTLSGIPANLIHYWQFNEGSGTTVEDIVGENPFGLGDASWVSSGAPVGSANISTGSVAASNNGPHTFGDVTLTMTDGFDNPVDVVVSELAAAPSNYPTGYASSVGGKYFVINLFGTPGTFTTSLTLTFGPGAITTAQHNDPGLLSLYKRESNSSGAWTLVATATAADSVTGQVTWAGITSFSQFLAVSSDNEAPPTITFTKKNYADWTSGLGHDRISPTVWLTRRNDRGLFNLAQEESYDSYAGGPSLTEWAFGTTANVGSLTFDTWYNTHAGDPPSTVNQDMVIHLVTEDVYLDVKFHSWTENGEGGGFSYTRSMMPFEVLPKNPSNIAATSFTVNGLVYSKNSTAVARVLYGTTSGVYTDSVLVSPGTIPLDTLHSIAATLTGLTTLDTVFYVISATNASEYRRTGEVSVIPHTIQYWSSDNGTITFEKSDYADWTQEANQDRITDAVWITRKNSQGIFNISAQSGYNNTAPSGTEWAAGSIADGVENLTFGTWHNTTLNTWGDKPNMVGQAMVLHLIDEDIYIDITFNSWTDNSNGGGFSYTRGASPLSASFTSATGVTASAASLAGKVLSIGRTATAKFLYGTTSGVYTDSVAVTPGTIDQDSLMVVTANLSSLSSGATYYVVVAALNDTLYVRSGEQSFVTLSALAGNALRFDGNNDRVEVGNESDFDFTTAVTLEAWVKPGKVTGQQGLIAKDDGDGAHPYQIRLDGDEVTFGFYSGGIDWNPVETNDANLTVGTWAHIAGTYDKDTAKIYVNGVLKAAVHYTFDIPTNNTALRIGVTNNGNNFQGVMDEVRVWNVARTQQQIQDNMNMPFTSAQSGLVGYWQFNASSGSVAQNHGTGSNGSLANFDFNSNSGWVASDAVLGPLAVSISQVSSVSNAGATVSGNVYSFGSNATAVVLYGTTSGVYTDSVSVTPGSITQDALTSVSGA